MTTVHSDVSSKVTLVVSEFLGCPEGWSTPKRGTQDGIQNALPAGFHSQPRPQPFHFFPHRENDPLTRFARRSQAPAWPI
jgi:hypothetical protein